MAEFSQSLFGFIVAIAVLVAFHEYGHFWVARRLGVRVLRFSIGFGRPLWSRVAADGTEYRVSAIPLGGYVKMLDEREGAVPENQAQQAFNRQSVWVRIAIVSAGPLANFLLAVLLYAAVFMIGQSALRPVLGEVVPESPAAMAGLQAGQIIHKVEDREIQSWNELRIQLLDQSLGRDVVAVSVASEFGGGGSTYQLNLAGISTEPAEFFRQIGLNPPRVNLAPILGPIMPGSAAAAAGLQTGDRVIAIDDESIGTWSELVTAVRARPGRGSRFMIERDGQRLAVAVNIKTAEGDTPYGQLGTGVAPQPERWEHLSFQYRRGPLDSLGAGLRQTFDMSWLTLKLLGRMILGEVSVKNLSGPLSIAEFAGQSAAAGLVTFLAFLALISVSLGVLNLLPVPVLDGGHLLYYLIEVVRGSPLSDKAQQLGQSLGLMLLFGLMSLALFNDINRIFG